jgi:ligand-binding sensor domain-containing protein
LVCLGAARLAAAQTPAYLHYGVQDGLPSNLVYCGTQDKRGLLWFGTDKGLACFDGTRFRTLGMKDGLPDPEVLNLMEDSAGRLWMSSYRKKPYYRQNGHFIEAQQDSMLEKMELQAPLWEFYEDADQSVWLSSQGPFFFRYGENGVESKRAEHSVVTPARIGGKLFFFGIKFIFQELPDGKMTIVKQLDAPPMGDVNPFQGMSISGNRVLYSFYDRLILLEWRDGQFVEVERRSSPLGRIFTDNQGRFWVCSLAEGAVCFDNKKKDLSNPVHFFKGEKVTLMFDDRQGTHWFCTTDNGIYAIPENIAVNFSDRDGLTSNNIISLASGKNEHILIGDDEGNLHELDHSNNRFSTTRFGSADGYNRIRCIVPTPGGKLWILTDETLFYVRGRSRQKIKINVSPKSAMFLGERLWFASSGGLYYVTERKLMPVQVAIGRFTAVGSDSDGLVWAGTDDGIYCQSDSFQTNFGLKFRALKTRIVAIQKAGKDSLWIVTPNDGLLLAQLKNGAIASLQSVNQQLAAPIDNIQSLYSEPDGHLWLATNRGVYRLDKFWNTVIYNRHDGLANNDVNAVLVKGDTLWAATVGGLSRLQLRPPNELGDFPTYIIRARYRADAQTLMFHFLDSSVISKNIVLPPNATLFEIELAGLDYRHQGNMLYECVTTQRLPAWQWWTLDNLLTWAANGFKEKTDVARVSASSLGFGVHLPPGCYQLAITAITPGSVRSRHPDVLNVEMRPHRYNTVWFWLLIWGLMAYAIWRIVRARNAFRKLDAAASELQLKALQTQMNPHFVGNSINAIQQFFYPPDPVRASEYIALFNRLLRRTLKFSEQTFIPFSEEIAYDRDYLEMLKLRFGDRFHYEITGAEAVPADTPFPSMLLQPLLENASQHGLAPDGVSMLKLDFSFSRKKLTCSVTDNGVGYRKTRELQKNSGTDHESKGLEILLQKVETLNRRYQLGLKLDLQDLSDTTPPLRGTRAVIRFYPK